MDDWGGEQERKADAQRAMTPVAGDDAADDGAGGRPWRCGGQHDKHHGHHDQR